MKEVISIQTLDARLHPYDGGLTSHNYDEKFAHVDDNMWLSPEISTLEAQTAVEDDYTDDDDELYDETVDPYSKYDRGDTYVRSGVILHRIMTSERSHSSEDARLQFMATTIDEFLIDEPDAVFDPTQAGSFGSTTRFMDHYVSKLDDTLAESNMPALLVEGRADFVRALGTPQAKRWLPKAARERGEYVATATPIVIRDPLSSLLEKRSSNHEKLGHFMQETRRIEVDPFSIEACNRPLYATGAQEKLAMELKLKQVLFHELMHTMTSTYYREKQYEHEEDEEPMDSHLIVQDLWPHYWYEAMSEKGSWLLLTAITDFDEIPEQASHELDWRRYVSHNPKQIVSGPSKATTQNHNDKLAAAYPENRLLVDCVLDKLDWKAAGISKLQAEKLSFAAFTELPAADGEAPTFTYRKAFIEAVNKAAHPGFFMKLANLVKTYDADLALDILIDPAFDPHDASTIPWIAGDAMRQDLSIQGIDKHIAYRKDRIAHIREDGSSPYLREHFNRHLAELERKKEDAGILETATAGLRGVLEAKHPKRPTVHPTSKDFALQRMLFGERPLRFSQAPRPQDSLAEDQRAVDAWVALQASRHSQPDYKS